MIGIFGSLFLAVIHIVVCGLDILALLLIVRLLALRWPKAIFMALNRVGTAVVDPMLQAVGRATHTTVGVHSHRGQIIAAVVLLVLMGILRLALTTMVSAVIVVRA